MFKAIFLAFSFMALSLPAARAEDFSPGEMKTADDGGPGRFTYKTGSDKALSAGRGYQLQQPGGTGPSDWTTQGWGDTTKTNGALSGNNPYGPSLPGANSGGALSIFNGRDSGAAQGGPIIVGGFNTFLAPANMALRTQYAGKFGGFKLPDTKLDSFVYKAPNAEMIYGDEGTFGPPPLDDFQYINTGIQSSGLTTGHKGKNLPSAWGTPEKYNEGLNFDDIRGQ